MVDELESLTRLLVEIPSHEDETAAGDWIESWLRDETAGVVERDDAGNVIARRGTGESLALVGHHDVVRPAPEQVADTEYRVEARDGRLYGRGTADMKGAVVAMLLAFRDADPGGELVFASFVEEETGGAGARHAIAGGFAPEYAIVGEGSTNYSGDDVTDVAVAHRGRRGIRVGVRGTAAHASEPEAGENAVYRACEAVGYVRGLRPVETRVYGHRLQGSVVVTGVADDETAENVIPAGCELTIDERTVPDRRAPLDRLEELPGVEIRETHEVPPMVCHDEGFAHAVLGAAQTVVPGAQLVVKPHATDASWLADAGVACVVCGPAEPGEAHTDTESVGIDVLDRCYRIYKEAAARGGIAEG